MDREQRLKALKEKVQEAISDYVYETGDSHFSALIEVTVVSGWTENPKIKKYVKFEE